MVENWPGYRDGLMGPDLMAEMRAQAQRFGAEITTGQIERADLRSRPFVLTLADGANIQTRALIVATGASARMIGLHFLAPVY